jgi:hypothetical protein
LDIDDVIDGCEAGSFSPHIFRQHLTRDSPPAIFREVKEQIKFSRGQFQLLAVSARGARSGIDAKVSHGYNRSFGWLLVTPEESVYSRHEFGERKWFSEIIVRSGSKPLNPVLDCIVRGKNQHPQVQALLANLP